MNSREHAKKIYDKIMNSNKDLYGCVVSINSLCGGGF